MKEFSLFTIKVFNETDERKWLPHIRRDWAIIICVSVVVFLAFATLHFFFYFTMLSGTFFSRGDTSVNSVPVRVQQKKLEIIIDNYQIKKETFDTIVKNPVPFSDPSFAIGAVVSKSPDVITPTGKVDLSQ